jgi:hypothetical protein
MTPDTHGNGDYLRKNSMLTKTWKAYLIRPLRRLPFPLHNGLTARLFGGFHLPILAR